VDLDIVDFTFTGFTVCALDSDQISGSVDDSLHRLVLAHEEPHGPQILFALDDTLVIGTKTATTILGLLVAVCDVLGELGGFRRLSEEALVKLGGGSLVVGLGVELTDERVVLAGGGRGGRAVRRSLLTLDDVRIAVLALEGGLRAISVVAVCFGAGGKCRGGQNSKLLHNILR